MVMGNADKIKSLAKKWLILMSLMQEEIIELIKKYIEGTASFDEINQLENWYNSFEFRPGLYQPGTVELDDAVTRGFEMLKLYLFTVKNQYSC
jgi:hypothetical protein